MSPAETIIVDDKWKCGYESPYDKDEDYYFFGTPCGHINTVTKNDYKGYRKKMVTVTCEKCKNQKIIYDVYDSDDVVNND